jgi:hypothetical protein
MGMVHQCQKTGDCASSEVEKIAKSIKKSDAKDFAETKHKKLPNKVTGESMTFREFILEGYYTKPPIDRERYAEREGLEGPFSGDNGKVYYYDPKEGKYYDPDTDFYLSQDEYEATQHSPEKRTELMNQQRQRDFERRR